MSYESLVGLHVIDHEGYRRYRQSMAPILARYGGGFRYDFTIDESLKSEATHPINRVFVIYFQNKQSKEAFFSDPEYKQIRTAHFEPSVSGATIIAQYDRSPT